MSMQQQQAAGGQAAAAASGREGPAGGSGGGGGGGEGSGRSSKGMTAAEYRAARRAGQLSPSSVRAPFPPARAPACSWPDRASQQDACHTRHPMTVMLFSRGLAVLVLCQLLPERPGLSAAARPRP